MKNTDKAVKLTDCWLATLQKRSSHEGTFQEFTLITS